METVNIYRMVWCLEEMDLPSDVIRWVIIPYVSGKPSKIYDMWKIAFDTITQHACGYFDRINIELLIENPTKLCSMLGFMEFFIEMRNVEYISYSTLKMCIFVRWCIENSYYKLLNWWCNFHDANDMFEQLIICSSENVIKWMYHRYQDKIDLSVGFMKYCSKGNLPMVRWCCDILSKKNYKFEDGLRNAHDNKHEHVIEFLLQYCKLRIYKDGILYEPVN